MPAEFHVLNQNRLALRKIFHYKFLKRGLVHWRRIQTALHVPADTLKKFYHVAQTRADVRFGMHQFNQRCLVKIIVAEKSRTVRAAAGPQLYSVVC